MSSLRQPVGPHSAATYWRRRATVLAAVLVVVYLLAQACDGSDPKQTNQARTQARPGTPQTPAAITPGGTAQPPASTPSATTTPEIIDPGGSELVSEGDSGTGGGAPDGGSGDSGAASAGGPAAPGSAAQVSGQPLAGAEGCPAGTAQLVASTDSRVYAAGRNPQFVLAIKNTGRTACRVDLRRNPAQLTVTSGPDRIWSTADCLKPQTASAVTVKPAQAVLVLKVAWERVRSQPNCPPAPPKVKAGTYVLTGSLTGLGSAKDVFDLR